MRAWGRGILSQALRSLRPGRLLLPPRQEALPAYLGYLGYWGLSGRQAPTQWPGHSLQGPRRMVMSGCRDLTQQRWGSRPWEPRLADGVFLLKLPLGPRT